ncbi:MAG: AAA family ATPase [Mycobacteriales bacterium]|nr:AAA family ATPase [Frankia sp.]
MALQRTSEADVCLSCAAVLVAGDALCRSCGEPTAPPERKLVTILFADLTGYTELCSRLDPEEVHNFARPAMTALRRVIEGFGGVVPSVQGDGFMAVFGAPVAHEDDAQRAARAAVALGERVAEINTGARGLRIPDLHIGVNSGEVLVAPSREVGGFSVAGETVNLASRLCSLAGGGHVLVGEHTYELARHEMRFGPRRLRRVRGLSALVPTYELLGVTAERAPGARLGRSAPFVGRTETIASLDAVWRKARETTTSRVTLVIGEPGAGKTRLAMEMVSRGHAKHVLSGKCSAYAEQLPLAPLVDAVTRWLGERLPADDTEIDRVVGAALAKVGAADADGVLTRQVTQLLGGHAETRPPSSESAAAETAALRALMEALAADGGVVLVVDDIHWADPELVDLLARLTSAPWNGAIWVLALARPGSALETTVPPLELPPLSSDESRELVTHLLGLVPPEAAAHGLMTRAGGNPLFLEECVRMLRESGALRVAEGTVVVDEAQIQQVPNTMRMFIAARLDGLAPAEKSLLQAASVVGDNVPDRLLTALLPGFDVPGLLGALDKRGLLRPARADMGGEVTYYAFKHALIRDVAYESVPRRQRARQHSVVAEWFSEAGAGDAGRAAPLALLAYHYHQAWLLGQSLALDERPSCDTARLAVEHLHAWGRLLFSRQARQAEAVLSQAVSVIQEAVDCFDAATRASVYVDRAMANAELGRFDDALSDVAVAEEWADEAAASTLVGRANLVRSRALSDLGRIDEARTACAAALTVFRAENDAGNEAEALYQAALNERYDDLSRTTQLLRETYAAHERASNRRGQVEVAHMLAYIQTLEGGPDHARWFAEAARLSDDDADIRSRAELARTEAFLLWHRGEYLAAVERAQVAHADAVAAGARWVEADALLCQQSCFNALGRFGDAERMCETALALAETVRARRLRAMALGASAQTLQRLRQPKVAAQRLREARDILSTLSTVDLSEVDALAADLAANSGEWARARRHAQKFIHAMDAHGWGLYAVACRLNLARAAIAAGRRDALDLIASALDATRRHDVPRFGALAGALLEQAQLLTGDDTASSRLATRSDSVDTQAVLAENDGLRALRAGDVAVAGQHFGRAAEHWSSLGATVWLARALLWQAEVTPAAGATGAETAYELLRDLDAPAGMADQLLEQLRNVR